MGIIEAFANRIKAWRASCRVAGKNPNGAILWRGPSAITGEEIVCIATGISDPTSNRKMIKRRGNRGRFALLRRSPLQLFYLKVSEPPSVSFRAGRDSAVCGTCPMREITFRKLRAAGRARKNGKCYVNKAKAPDSIWKAFQAGRYMDCTSDPTIVTAGRMVRFGAEGDPASAGPEFTRIVAESAIRWTGYTHQWIRFPAMLEWCMASVESPALAALAARMHPGARSFLTLDRGGAVPSNGGSCPASKEAGARVGCFECFRCDGANNAMRAPEIVTIELHS